MTAFRPRVFFLLFGIGIGLLLIVHGLLTVAGGGSGWDSNAERIVFGALQALAGASIIVGLLCCAHTPRLGLTLVAAGAAGVTVLFYWLAVFTIPAGIVLLAITYKRGREIAASR